MATKKIYINAPCPPEVAEAVREQAKENCRSAGREAALLLEKGVRRRLAKKEAEAEAK